MVTVPDSIIQRCKSVFAPIVIDVPVALLDEYHTLFKELSGLGFFVARIDENDILTVDDLYNALSSTCNFPSHFGRNWDALKDCFLDFSWIDPRPKGYSLIYRNPQLLNWSALAEFISTSEEVRAIRAPRRIPFKLLFPTDRPIQ